MNKEVKVSRKVWRVGIYPTYWINQSTKFDVRKEVLRDFLDYKICGMPTWSVRSPSDFPIQDKWCEPKDRFHKDLWNIFWNISPGDRVVLIEQSKRVLAKGYVRSYAQTNKSINTANAREKYPVFVDVEWDKSFNEFDAPGLQGGGTFFHDLSDSPEQLNKTQETSYMNMTRPYIETTNLILCGPPGTGKTFRTKRTACEICLGAEWRNSNDEDAMSKNFKQLTEGNNPRVEFITFHPNYDYSDFIEGFRPVNEGFQLQDGILVNLAKRAEQDPENNYLLIIDEINRGNIAKIFGETITLLEDDKRIKGDFELRCVLPASRHRFGLPSNLYIRGTMNTADRSIAMLDIALRRRFEFEEVQPDPELLKGADIKTAEGVIKQSELMANLNEILLKKEILGNRDYQIGHAWFAMPKKGKKSESVEALTDRLVSRFKKKIVPLLQEWMYESPEKLWGTKNDIENSVFGCVFKQENPSSISAESIFKLQEHLKNVLKKNS